MNALADRDFCAALVLSLVHFLWQGTLIAGVVAIAARRQKTAHARYNVLVAAFCLMAISPFGTLAIRSLIVENSLPPAVSNELPVDAGQIIANSRRLPAPSNDPAVPTDVSPGEDLTQLPAVAPIPTAPPITSSADKGWQQFAPLMMNVYLLGVAAMLLRLVVGVWGGWRLRHRSTPVEEVALLQALRRQAQSLGMKCVPVLAWCESVAVPTVIGILKPTILLPLSLTSGLAADQVESVLAHELAHLRRYDHLVNLFQRVVESLLFFHPAVWWLSNRIRIEREHCCDDMVVACGAVPLDYAKSLLRVAELSRQSRRNRSVSAVSLLATGQPSTLRQRIARLLGDATDTHVRFLHRWPAILLATLCLLVAWTTTRVGWGLPPKSDEQPAPFMAELPGGIKVELLSIGYHQTLMKKWWAADGTVLPAEPRDPKLKRVEFSSFTGGSLQGEAREIAVRITGIPKQETFFGYQFCWEPYGDAVSNAVVYEPSEFTSASMPLVSQLKDKKVSLRICIDPLPEEIVRTISADGKKKLGGDPISEVLRRVDELVQPVRVEKLGDQTELLLKPVNRGAGPPISEWVPVAIDKVGGRHESIQAGGREGFFTYRYPVALSEIARFEYRLKPYRHWVTFSNLSVHPGEKTDVKVKVESLQTAEATPVTAESADEQIGKALQVAAGRQLTIGLHSPWQIMQGLKAFGRDWTLLTGENERTTVRIDEWIASGPAFDGEPVWQVTEAGARAHPFTKKFSFESHPGQFLASLAAADVPPEFVLQAADGAGNLRKVTVRDVLNDTKQQIKSGEVHSWVLSAIAHYEPIDVEWTNRAGDKWSIVRLVESELERSIVNDAVGGCPRLLALASARDMYRKSAASSDTPLPDLWRKVDQLLEHYAKQTKQFQNPDGSFSADFYRGIRLSKDINERLLTTGAPLTWLVVALPDEQLKAAWMARAMERLSHDLLENPGAELDVHSFCNAVHALRLYQERTRGTAPKRNGAYVEAKSPDAAAGKSEPQSQYQTATYLQEKISAKIPDAAWGKPNKGLRLAMVIREESKTDWNELPAGTRVPASWALRQGDQIHSQLVVENVSDKPINLTGYTYTEVERSFAVFDSQQKELSTNSTHIDIPPIPTSWKLLPGERYLLQMPPIAFLDAQSEHRGIGYYVRTPPGEYTVRCGYAFGQRGKDDPRPAPDPSEWTGVLQAGDIKVTVDDPSDKTASRVRRGQDALDRIDQFKPAWGELRSGIQMGLARLGETDKFRPGQRVPLEFYLRNVGKQTAKIRFHVEFYSDVPTVRDADGKEVKVELVHLLGARARFTETLKPGEAVAWPHWGLGIGPNRPAGYSSIWHPFVADPRAGTYTVAQSLDSQIEVEGSSERGGGLKSGTIKIEIVAEPVAVNEAGPTVTGTLVGLDGKPVPGIEIVAFEGQKLLSQKFTTDERGQFRVPKAWRDADHMLTVVARDGAERFGWFDFFLNGHSDNGQKAADGSFQMVLLPLERTVSGRLVDPDGNPLERVSVQIEFLQHSVNFSSTSWPGRKIGDVPLLQGAITNEDGKFELKVPAEASGVLRMSSVDWVGQRILFKRNEAALGDTRTVRAAKVAGQVTDSRTGKPVAGVSIGAQALKPDLQSGGWGDATTDQDGRYVIGGLPGGDYNILLLDGAGKTLTAAAHDTVRLNSAETLRADFSMIVGRRLSGRVLDEKTGQPIAGCYVGYQGTARPQSGGAIEGATTNAKGEFELFVPPGKSHVYVADARETGSDSRRDIEVPQDRDPEPVILKAGPKDAETGKIKVFVGTPSERLVSLKANRMPLQDALTELCRQAAVKLELDGDGLKSQGYTRNMPISLELQNEPLGDAVKLVLKPFEKLDFTFDKDTLFVSSAEQVKIRKQKAENGESYTDSKLGAISGTLIDDTTGMPVAGAAIGCQLVAGKEGKVPMAVTSDHDGKYLLKDVPVGIYNVWVKKYDDNPKLVAAADQGIDVKAGQTASSSLRLVEGRMLRGTIVNRGQPVADELIGCYSAARPQSTAHVQSTKSAADGTFEFLLPPGPAYLYTMSGGFTDKKRLYASENTIIPAKGDVPPIMLQLTEKESLFGSTDWVAGTTKGTEIIRRNAGAYVSGVVVDPDGKPIPKAVLIKAENWNERIWTDDKGEFNLKVDRGTQFVFAVHAAGYNVWSGTPTTGDVLKIVLEPKVSSKAAADPGKQPGKTETKSDAVQPGAASAATNSVFERVKTSLVVVTTKKSDEEGRDVNGLTIGAIVDERGYILVNGIILQKADPNGTRVRLDTGAIYPADLVAVDLSSGMALLRIKAKETLVRISLGSSADLKQEDPVIAAKAVFAPKSAEVKSLVVATGTISGLHQDLELGRKVDYTNLIAVDIDTIPGGGPIWNAAGKLIGFTVLARFVDRKQAFAKEIDSILPFLKKEIPPVP